MYAEKAFLGRVPFIPGGGFSTSFVLNSSTAKFAVSFVPTDAITVAKVAFVVGSKTGSPTFTVRLETDSSGRPSGTLVATNATATGQAISANGWTGEISLTASAALSPGTLYHLVVTNDNGTPASNNFAVVDQTAGGFAQASAANLPQFMTTFTASYNGTTWSNRNGPIFVLSDSGGTTKIGQPFDTSGLLSPMASGTWYGLKFSAPFTGQLAGAQIAHLPNTGIGQVTVRLYDGSDNLLATSTLPTGLVAALGNARLSFAALFDSGPVNITSGTTYRFVMNDAGGADRIDFVTAPSAPVDYRTLLPIAQSYQWTQGSTGSWTDTPGKLPCYWGLIASSVSAGGSGGIIRVNQNGGYAA